MIDQVWDLLQVLLKQAHHKERVRVDALVVYSTSGLQLLPLMEDRHLPKLWNNGLTNMSIRLDQITWIEGNVIMQLCTSGITTLRTHTHTHTHNTLYTRSFYHKITLYTYLHYHNTTNYSIIIGTLSRMDTMITFFPPVQHGLPFLQQKSYFLISFQNKCAIFILIDFFFF